MTELSVLQEGSARRAAREARARRARRRHRVRVMLSVGVLGFAALLGFMASGASDPGSAVRSIRSRAVPAVAVQRAPGATGYGASLAPAAEQVAIRLKLPVRSGVLFDVHSGRVLWERDPARVVAIASLTKMMTALVVVEHARPQEPVLVTRSALAYSGSGIGLLPLHKRISVETMLYGLLLPSGNDAAIALAQHVAGSEARFIAMMNARASALGLRCTHFTTVSGIVDRGNHSCATDLARIAHLVLEQPMLARIVASPSVVRPFPIKGGKLYLYNNNPLLRLHYPGADGVKTGFTDAAGRCLVATARRGRKWLGVVLLHSKDPPDQAIALLNAGFAKLTD
jgi:D-alanyl-D-alanine carboxypeptidase